MNTTNPLALETDSVQPRGFRLDSGSKETVFKNTSSVASSDANSPTSPENALSNSFVYE